MEFFEQYQTLLQMLVVGAIVAAIIGLYWRLIAIGVCAFAIIFLFAYKPAESKSRPVSEVVQEQKVETITIEPKKEEPVTESQQQAWHREFMEDCMTVSANSKEQCEDIWKQRLVDEKNPEKMAVKWKMYKQYKARYL